MTITINVADQRIPFPTPASKPQLKVGDTTTPIPAEQIGPVILAPKPPTDPPLLSVSDAGEVEAKYAKSRKLETEVKTKTDNPVTDSPNIDTTQNQIEGISIQRDAIDRQQKDLVNEGNNIERQLEQLNNREKQLSQRLQSLKQQQELGQVIDVNA